MNSPDPRYRRLVMLLYVTGGLLLLDQVIDLVSTLLATPPSPGSAQWRFGAFGLFVTRGSVLIVADAMLWIAAVVLEHRRAIRVLAAAHLVLGALVIVSLGFFGLDALELRRTVPAGGLRRYDSAALRASMISVLGAGMLIWSGVSGWAATSGGGRRRPGAVIMEGRKVKEVHR